MAPGTERVRGAYRVVKTLYCIISHGLQLGVFKFFSAIHAKTNAKQMHPRSLRPMRHFMRVHLYAQTATDAGEIHT